MAMEDLLDPIEFYELQSDPVASKKTSSIIPKPREYKIKQPNYSEIAVDSIQYFELMAKNNP